MSLSPLIFEYFFYRKASYSLKKPFESGDVEFPLELPDPEIEVKSESARADDDHDRWRVSLDIKAGHKGRKFPYILEIGITGYFRVRQGFPEDKAPLLIQVNGPSILYAGARDFASILTARAPHPPILLPSLSFVPEAPEPMTTTSKTKRAKKTK